MINMIRSTVDKLIHDDGEISTNILGELFPLLFGDLLIYGPFIVFGETEKCMDFICEYLKQKNIVLFPIYEKEKTIDTRFDVVSRPSHYIEGRKYEPRKVIADWGLNFNLGNAVKYLSRAGRKGNKIEDLRKAIQYIEFEIEELEEKKDE